MNAALAQMTANQDLNMLMQPPLPNNPNQMMGMVFNPNMMMGAMPQTSMTPEEALKLLQSQPALLQ